MVRYVHLLLVFQLASDKKMRHGHRNDTVGAKDQGCIERSDAPAMVDEVGPGVRTSSTGVLSTGKLHVYVDCVRSHCLNWV
jgi:hypothetical protein